MTTVNVTLYFYYVCTYREVKTPILRYHTITHVGIVQFEGKNPHQTPKTPSPWWSYWRLQWHGYGELANTLVVASSEGSDQGQGARVLFNYVNWQRKKIISKLIDFVLFYYPLPT